MTNLYEMEISVDTKALLNALLKIKSAVPNRVTVPILGAVILEVVDGRLKLQAGEIDIGIREYVDCEIAVFEDGVTYNASFKDLLNVVKSAKRLHSSLNLAFDRDNHLLMIYTEEFTINLRQIGNPSDVYDFIQDEKIIYGEDSVPVEYTVFLDEWRRMMKVVAPAISTEETRYYLNGVCIKRTEQGHDIVATDGHRLHLVANRGKITPNWSECILPKALIHALNAYSSKEPVLMKFVRYMDRIYVYIGDSIISAKLIDGTYPDYTKVIPKEHSMILGGDAPQALRAVEFLRSLPLDGDIRTMPIKCEFQGMEVRFNRSSDVSNGMIKVPLTTSLRKNEDGSFSHDPEKFAVGYNGKYLAQVLSFILGNFEITCTDIASPAVVKDEHNPDITMVIMPLRIQ